MTGRGFSFGTFASSQVGMTADIQVDKKIGQDHRPALRGRPEQRDHGHAGRRREPDERLADPGPFPGDARAPPWNKERITSIDWVTYPILRFKDSPKVTLINVRVALCRSRESRDVATRRGLGGKRAGRRARASEWRSWPPHRRAQPPALNRSVKLRLEFCSTVLQHRPPVTVTHLEPVGAIAQ